MTKILLLKTYKSRKPGVILNIPETEAKSLEALGLGRIVKAESVERGKPAKVEKVGAAE